MAQQCKEVENFTASVGMEISDDAFEWNVTRGVLRVTRHRLNDNEVVQVVYVEDHQIDRGEELSDWLATFRLHGWRWPGDDFPPRGR